MIKGSLRDYLGGSKKNPAGGPDIITPGTIGGIEPAKLDGFIRETEKRDDYKGWRSCDGIMICNNVTRIMTVELP